ncbi:MAG: MOSC domain-containing protein [Balneolaceae bacterium]|nr:MAG: MOSC domain-containing protein [Balneolaceae bacterium]
MQITELNLYPVKSLRGIRLEEAVLGVRGLKYDRWWMVTDSRQGFITQREMPAMATISVHLTDEFLVLSHPSVSPLEIDLHRKTTGRMDVTIWKDRLPAMDEGSKASLWLTEVLGSWNGRDLNLFRFSDESIRLVDASRLQGEDSHTAFADGFPFLITSEESLALLNKNLEANGASRITMDRFRPNIVIRGAEPFEEDAFDTLASIEGTYTFGIRKPCKRCPVTTTDQATGERMEPKEPLRTLAMMNTQPDLQGAFFGQNATLLSEEGRRICIGDRLKASKKEEKVPKE